MQESLISSWFRQALSLGEGDLLYIPCDDKEEQTVVLKSLKKEVENYHAVNLSNITVRFKATKKDKRYWVTARTIKKYDPSVGWVKHGNTLTKISLGDDYIRRRSITFMIQDGLSREEIEENLEDCLTEEEIREFLMEE